MDKQDHNNDIEDLDEFLKEDSSQNIRKFKVDKVDLTTNAVSSLPRTKDPVQRLDNRITHIWRSIEALRENRAEFKIALDQDEQFSTGLTADAYAWDSMIKDLEKTLGELPNDIDMSQLSEIETQVLPDDIASQIDTYVQEAAELEKETNQADDADTPDEFTLFKITADEMFDQFPGVEDQLDEDTRIEDTAMNRALDENTTEDSGLRRTLEERDTKIRQLETELETLKASLPMPVTLDEIASENTTDNQYVNRLFIVTGSDRNLKFPLTQQIMTVGREPHNDIHIRSKYVSRYHARIVCDQDGTVIEDLDSRNGLSVNSRRVRRKQLSSGDLIDIGRVQFKYIDLMEGDAGEGQA